MVHCRLRTECWQRDCGASNGGPPELNHSIKGTGSAIRVDAPCTCGKSAGLRERARRSGDGGVGREQEENGGERDHESNSWSGGGRRGEGVSCGTFPALMTTRLN